MPRIRIDSRERYPYYCLEDEYEAADWERKYGPHTYLSDFAEKSFEVSEETYKELIRLQVQAELFQTRLSQLCAAQREIAKDQRRIDHKDGRVNLGPASPTS